MNLDPNAVKQIDMNYFFTAAELGMASNGSSVITDILTGEPTLILLPAIQHFAHTGRNR